MGKPHTVKDTMHDRGMLVLALRDENDRLCSALEELRKELRARVKFDVKRHFSLMVADAAAGTALAKART